MSQANRYFSATGKIILAGEHAVIDGYPALSIPIPEFSLSVRVVPNGKTRFVADDYFQNICATFQDFFKKKTIHVPNISVQSSIPENSGFGSSAAFSYAVVQMLAHYNNTFLSKADAFQIVQQCEKFVHGNPSGVDAATITVQQPIIFQKKPNGATWEEISDSTRAIPQFFIIQSGTAKESTKEMIEKAQKHSQKNEIFQKISSIVQDVTKQLRKGTCDISLFQQNERLLEMLGVVGNTARHIIRNIERYGGVAKVCGAGGCAAGSGVIIAFHTNMNMLKECVQKYSIPILGRYYHED